MPVGLTKCGGCDKEVTREDVKRKRVVSAIDRLWHEDHIECVFCKLPITDRRLFRSEIDDSKAACYACHVSTTHPACSGCNLPVAERGLSAFQRLFHIDCFRCSTCNRAIGPNTAFYEMDLSFFCRGCYFLSYNNL